LREDSDNLKESLESVKASGFDENLIPPLLFAVGKYLRQTAEQRPHIQAR
jgi:hypothetical protein